MNISLLNPITTRSIHGMTPFYACLPDPPGVIEKITPDELHEHAIRYIQTCDVVDVDAMIYSLDEHIREYIHMRADKENINTTDSDLIDKLCELHELTSKQKGNFRTMVNSTIIRTLIQRVRKSLREAWIASKGFTIDYNDADLLNWVQNVVFNAQMLNLEDMDAEPIVDQKLRMMAADKLANYIGLNDRKKEVSLELKLPEPPTPTRKQVEHIPLKQLHVENLEETLDEVLDDEEKSTDELEEYVDDNQEEFDF